MHTYTRTRSRPRSVPSSKVASHSYSCWRTTTGSQQNRALGTPEYTLE